MARHGRPIARPAPEAERRRAEIDEAVESIKRSRVGRGPATVEDVLSSVREGRRWRPAPFVLDVAVA